MDTVAPLPAAPARPDLSAPAAPSTDKSNDARAFGEMLQKLGNAKNDQTDAKDSGSKTPSAPSKHSDANPPSKASTATSNDTTGKDATSKTSQTDDDDKSTATEPAAASPKADAASPQTAALALLAAQINTPPVVTPTAPMIATTETPADALAASSAKSLQAAAATAASTGTQTQTPATAQPTEAAGTTDKTAAATPAVTPTTEAAPTAPAPATPTAQAAATPTPAAAATQEAGAAAPVVDPAARDATKTSAPTDPNVPASALAAAQAQPSNGTAKVAPVKQATDDAKEPETKESEHGKDKSFAEHVAATRDASEQQAPKVEVAAKPATTTETTPQLDPARTAQTQTHGLDAARATQSDTTLLLAPKNAALAASAVAQVGFHLSRAGLDGQQTMTIQLRPEALGSIEVKLDIGRDGVVNAHVVADRSDTLDLLRSDPRGLQRALENAGLTTDGGSLSFDLRQNGHGSQNGLASAQTGFSGGNGDDMGSDLDLAVVERPRVVADGRVDVTV